MSEVNKTTFIMTQTKGIFEDGKEYLTNITPIELSSFNTSSLKINISSELIIGTAYYLSFTIKNITNKEQKYYVRLCSKEDSYRVSQTLKTITLTANQTKTFEIIFSPKEAGLTIAFESPTELFTDVGEIVNPILNKINNIVNQGAGKRNIKKIGIHGNPGLMFTLDGGEFRIGRTGVYELYNDDIEIDYIGFVVKASGDYFIMDYKYEEVQR